MKVQSILTQRGTRYILLDDEYNSITDVNKYLKYLDNIGRSPNTQRSYAYNLLLFCQYMSQEDIPLKELCSNPDKGPVEILSKFILWLQYPDYTKGIYHLGKESCHRSNSTVNHIMSAVLNFYNYLAANNEIQQLDVYRTQVPGKMFKSFLYEMIRTKVNHKSSILKKPVTKQPVNGITREQFKILFSLCENRRDRLLVALLFESGLRLNETLGIHISDLSRMEDNIITIVARENNENGARVKNYAEGIIYLPDYVIDLLLEYMNEDIVDYDSDFLFLNLYGKHNGRPLKDNAVEQLFLRLSKKAGFKVHPHMLRHGFAQEKLEAGWPLEEVQSYLRHRNPTSTELYAHYTDAMKIAQMQKFIQKHSDIREEELYHE